jgi:hypothetical protein
MAESTLEHDPKAEARADRRAGRLARQIGAFGRAHGDVRAQLAYLGQCGARIVLVAEDGTWGDLVAPTYDIGLRAVRRSGVTVHEDFDAELAARVRTGPYEWSRMAGIQIGGRANT